MYEPIPLTNKNRVLKRHLMRAGLRAKVLNSLNEESNYHKIKNYLEKERI